ncbi:MAG: tetratricopeptide repeat protein [Planctomycetes bacterium]|nr:tetratricopeptide repeat protein [Planctomycetota bacterium]
MHPTTQPPDDMDAGLRAAFGDEASPSTPSVLRLLQKRTGSRLDLHLDANDESGLPVRIDEETKALRDPAGRYQVLGEIGRGGVGIVYKGRDQDLGRDVAMKVLRAEYASRPEILERFVEEAQIGGQLQHPGIVPVYELGLQQGERPYFAMKLVKGDTLATLLSKRSSPVEDRHRFLAIFAQICQTLAYAHARRVVHRDLKPANVMLGSFGEVQVVDWGFAKVLQRGEVKRADATQKPATLSVISTLRSDPQRGSQSIVGSTMGTPAYMPPEQAMGDVENMDERSDVFGLGGILCEILTGEPPYLERDGDLLTQAARCNLQGVQQRLLRCGADEALVELCRQCLAPSRLARPASGKEVADATAAYLASVEQRAHDAEIRAVEAKMRARSTALLAMGAVLVLALGGAGYWLYAAEAAGRRERAEQRVVATLREASERLGAARAAAVTELAVWTRAVDAAQQAESLAHDADVSSEQRAEAAGLLTIVQSEQKVAAAQATRLAKDAVMRQRLVDARMALQEFAMRASESADAAGARAAVTRRYDEVYGRAFAEYLDGRDPGVMPREEAIAALQGPLAVELATALDNWAIRPTHYLASQPQSMPERGRHLQAIAMALDPDPWRNRLRALLTSTQLQPEAVRSLCADTDLGALPVVNVQLLALALYGIGERNRVRQIMEEACDRNPTDFGIAFDLGTLYLMAERPDRAEAHLRTARALLPTSALTHHNLSVAQLGMGQLSASLGNAKQAVALEPDNPQVLNHLGNVLVQVGKVDEGIVRLRRAVVVDPKYPLSWNSLGVALLAKNEADEAAACFRTTIELAPKFAEAHHNLGDALIEQNRTEEAIVCYREALALAPRDVLTMNNLALSLERLGQMEDAMAMLRRLLEVDPRNGPANLNLGRRLEATGNLAEALVYWRRAEATWRAATDPFGREWHGKVLATIAKAESELGMQDELLALARGGATNDPQKLVASANLVYRRGEHGLATATYERAFAAFPALLETVPHRYNAACVAVLAGCGKGAGTAELTAAERARWRELARRWLADELRAWRRDFGREPAVAAAARRAAGHAERDPELAGVREAEALSALPAVEADAWRAFWQELAALLATR